MILASLGEAIRGIHEYLQRVPIEEEISTLRFRMGMTKAENASLRGKIRTIEAIETVTCSQERRTLKFQNRVDMIHGRVTTSKPKTMQDVIEFATKLMDKKIRTLAERQAENKRKLDNNNQA
ncbi:hypothetical protein Tco_0260038 [Tanacetum coccineum]